MMETADKEKTAERLSWMESKKGLNHSLDFIRKVIEEHIPLALSIPAIQIAGTNGKGSTCQWLADMFALKGLKAGMFTSPHLECHNERWRIHGLMMSDEEWMALFDKWQPIFEAQEFTMFEMDLFLALDWFSSQNVDWMILETGLGGGKDAVTAMDFEVQAITNIGMDHMAWLGESLEEIALAKAQIARKGTPLLTTEKNPVCLEVFETQASQAGTALEVIDTKPELWISKGLPEYQKENYALAKAVFDRMGFFLSYDEQEELQKHFEWKGRFTRLQDDPMILADGAHNLQGIEALVQSCLQQDLKIETIYFSVLSDKQAYKMLDELKKLKAEIILVSFEAQRLADLQKIAGELNLLLVSFDQMIEQLKATEKNTLVCGSLYFIAALLEEWKKESA